MAPLIHNLEPLFWMPAVLSASACVCDFQDLLFSIHSLYWFAVKVRAGSSSSSRLPGSSTVSKQLWSNTRPPGSEFTLWFTQHPSVLLAGIFRKKEERMVWLNEGGRSRCARLRPRWTYRVVRLRRHSSWWEMTGGTSALTDQLHSTCATPSSTHLGMECA